MGLQDADEDYFGTNWGKMAYWFLKETYHQAQRNKEDHGSYFKHPPSETRYPLEPPPNNPWSPLWGDDPPKSKPKPKTRPKDRSRPKSSGKNSSKSGSKKRRYAKYPKFRSGWYNKKRKLRTSDVWMVRSRKGPARSFYK